MFTKDSTVIMTAISPALLGIIDRYTEQKRASWSGDGGY
jgi:hypothetical protein